MNFLDLFTQRCQDQRWMVSLCTLQGCRLELLATLLFVVSILGGAKDAGAQGRDPLPTAASKPTTTQPNVPATEAVPAAPAMFAHPDSTRYFIAGQANIIFQAHAPFHSPYAAANSLLGRGEYKTSMVGTLYLGIELLRNPAYHLEALYDEESAGGRGISEALGLAGFTNLDVVRNPTLGPVPYLARVELHQTIGLSSKMIDAARGPFSLATRVPERRLELRFGKMGLPDSLDLNTIGTDSHLQFMNWTTDNNGAWDYAADTRGYTYGAIAEYDDRRWSARYGLALMPTVANGVDLDWNLKRASGQNAEIEWRGGSFGGLLKPDRKGVVRALGYVNHGHMGLYRAANAAYITGTDSVPDITKYETFSAVKYGVGLNAEQEVTGNLRVFGRFGWNEGAHESFAYTEVDQTFELGGDFAGKPWRRTNDKVGLAFVSNAIKRDHQAYLRLGGLGFLIGDGRLNYAREDIVEGYYNLHAWRGVFYSLDAQYVAHPGYNQDRGSVLVESVRMHVDF